MYGIQGCSYRVQIVRDIDPKVLRGLEIGRKRALICREYERIQDSLRDDAKLVLSE